MSAPGLDADVVVVGFGPVGATTAGLAARHGLRTLVVDRATELDPLPRAAHCDGEIVRILQELGCAEEIVATMISNEGMDFLDAQRQVLLRFDSPPDTTIGWPSSVLFHQPGFERALRAAVVAAGAEVRLGTGIAEVRQHDDHVALTADDGTVLRASWVVGCDGARSALRAVVGTGLDDLGFEEPWLVLDLLLREPIASLPRRALQVCDPARPHTLVPMPFPRFRFEFMLLPGEEAADIDRPDVIRELLAGWIDPDLVEVERSAVYTFHGLIAERWRDRRVLLAGDAAHQMPPFLGQGMCSGMRDAANLVWKLAAVERGAPAALLDTYQAEREPHVRAIIEAAVSFGRIICTTDPAVAAERDAGLRAAASGGAQPPLPHLAGGPLLAPGGGGLAPQPRLDDRLLDDVVGPRWTVIVRSPLAPEHPAGPWTDDRAVVLDAERWPELLAVLADDEAVVIRPDRHVFGRGALAPLAAAAGAALAP
ncbi:MAG: bifunctional 3-(3-hydroxy-phenyl)propionate/3-hydroxycinnamic acid hydroxylase [Acidimicrobiales bacterium]